MGGTLSDEETQRANAEHYHGIAVADIHEHFHWSSFHRARRGWLYEHDFTPESPFPVYRWVPYYAIHQRKESEMAFRWRASVPEETAMIRVPKRLGILLMGIGGIIGMRTPPEPEAIAQTVPRPNSGASGDASTRASTEMPSDLPYSERRQAARRKDPPVK
jgi:hypothetical protein